MMHRYYTIAFLTLAALLGGMAIGCGAHAEGSEEAMKKANAPSKAEWRELTQEEERVIVRKGTERPFSGKFDKFTEAGTYHCRRCDAELYRSTSKFDSGCGWPSFDDEVKGAVKRTTDADGARVEITCAACGGHLGHVFEGERMTPKNVRHCVNSVSLDFRPAGASAEAGALSEAYFAGGCFWGVEHLMQEREGVVSVVSGYMGGRKANPTYKEVCSGTTGHLEVVKVEYDESKISYEELAKLFFEIHDPTHVNRQGPDVGEQYKSAVFYMDDTQKRVAENLIGILREKGLKVATEIRKADTFWPAEDYHQDYYEKTGKTPYCHAYVKRF